MLIPRSAYEEERTIYMIKPEFLIEDLTRAFRKLGLEPLLAVGDGSWVLTGSSGGKKASVKLVSSIEVVESLSTLGPIPVSRLTMRVEGPEDFIISFRHRVEIELLRCLG